MCGIGGYVDPRGVLDGPGVLTTLAHALAHRGPDSEGFLVRRPFGLAHRRLAIIDPSDRGAQPMTVGPIVVVFNGAIYNYRELRAELTPEFPGSIAEALRASFDRRAPSPARRARAFKADGRCLTASI